MAHHFIWISLIALCVFLLAARSAAKADAEEP